MLICFSGLMQDIEKKGNTVGNMLVFKIVAIIPVLGLIVRLKSKFVKN